MLGRLPADPASSSRYLEGAQSSLRVVVHDASDPANPEVVGQFGDAPLADEEIRPWRPDEEEYGDYTAEVWPAERYYAGEGNARYVEPTPDGAYTFVGDEKFPNRLGENPPAEKFGGVRVFDTGDFDDVERVGYIAPPEGDRLRTAHNFRVTRNRLHSGWYHGGVRVHDIEDRENPAELARYRPEGVAFWTAVYDRGTTVGGVYGARSDDHTGGVVFPRNDRGEKRPPGVRWVGGTRRSRYRGRIRRRVVVSSVDGRTRTWRVRRTHVPS